MRKKKETKREAAEREIAEYNDRERIRSLRVEIEDEMIKRIESGDILNETDLDAALLEKNSKENSRAVSQLRLVPWYIWSCLVEKKRKDSFPCKIVDD